ncbi:MAG: hypothetical protein WB755_02070 [Terriglobales bacterium]|jgi:hypothetical protein
MPSKLKAAKKPYSGPSFRMLDAQAARAELEAKGDPKEANIQKKLSAAAERIKDKTKAPAVKVGARRGVKWPFTLVS